MEKIYLHPDATYVVRMGDGFFYLWFNAEKLKKSSRVKTNDLQGSLYQHSVDEITNNIHETIQKGSSPVIFNPVNTRSFSGLLGFFLACVCSIAVEMCFIIIGTAYRICNRTLIYPSSFFRRHTVDLAAITGLRKYGLFHVVFSPNAPLHLTAAKLWGLFNRLLLGTPQIM